MGDNTVGLVNDPRSIRLVADQNDPGSRIKNEIETSDGGVARGAVCKQNEIETSVGGESML